MHHFIRRDCHLTRLTVIIFEIGRELAAPARISIRAGRVVAWALRSRAALLILICATTTTAPLKMLIDVAKGEKLLLLTHFNRLDLFVFALLFDWFLAMRNKCI